MAVWYESGLRFTCTQCGNCCTGAPGFTWVDGPEIEALAAKLGLDEDAFRRKYIREVWRGGELRTSLMDKKNNDCVFYARGVGCTVYAERPKQCRSWPFWKRVVETPEDWQDAARECPGIGRGALHDAASIGASASDDGIP
ncbi:MAG: YkgJ family cysteine cluster protein [Planctomycetes bacterium]|nr:YkgJ family cysteine cluster protein [Planctomycetota bacterium]